MSPPDAPTPVALLAQAGFVRSLARAALRGDAEFEDLEQDTWVAALERDPRRGEVHRGWLGAVVRHRALDLLRSRRRRLERERRAARPEAIPGPDEVVARAELGRRLVAAVLALEEPSRTAILLRYLDELPTHEVAARIGVPVETARTRIKRGLDRLRARLAEAERAQGRDWRRAWAPLLGAGAAPSTMAATLGGALMAKKLVLLAGALLLAGLGTWALLESTGPHDVPGDHGAASIEAPASAGARAATPTLQGLPATDAPAAPSATPTAMTLRPTLRGIVVDEEGTPVAGASVWALAQTAGQAHADVPGGARETRSAQTLTDAAGRFVLEPRPAPSRLALKARAPGFVLLAPGGGGQPVWTNITEEARLVMTRGVPLRVRVTAAEDGRPLAGARVETYSWAAYSLHMASPADEATTDADGWAVLTVSGAAADVVVQAPGRAEAVLWAHPVAAPASEVQVALTQGGALRGVVVDPDARPIPGARLTLLRAPRRWSQAESDASGRFGFSNLRPPGAAEELEARRIVILACDAPGFGRQFLTCAPPAEGQSVEVTFALAAPLPLEGRVRTADGRPAAGVRVGYVRVEGDPHWGWTQMRGMQVAVTGADGLFRTDPLPPGRVALWAPIPLDRREPTRTVDLPLGDPLELTVDAAPPTLQVRVLDPEGRPVAGAQVRVHVPADSPAAWDPTPPRTDVEGRAVLTPSGPGPYKVSVDAPGAGPLVREVTAAGPTHETDLRLGSGRIEGRLVRWDGRPAQARLALYGTVRTASHATAVTGNQGAVETDAEGRFRFERVSEGMFGLQLLTEGLVLLDQGMDLSPGGPSGDRRVLTLPEAVSLTPVVEVAFEGDAAHRADAVHVVAERAGGEGSALFLWDPLAGVHRAQEPALPGAWTVRASAEGYESAQTTLTLAIGGSTPRARLVLRPRR